MPLYEYSCRVCQSRFEALVRSFRDGASCPRCESADVERLLSTFATSTGNAAGAKLGPIPTGGGCGGGCRCAH